MKLKLTGDCDGNEAGLNILAGHLGLSFAGDGFPVHLISDADGLSLTVSNHGATIAFQDKALLCRGFTRLAAHLAGAAGNGGTAGVAGTANATDDTADKTAHAEAPFRFSEKRNLQTLGVMLDTSRNAVPTVDSIKKLLRNVAAMGFNMLMLYMEDTFEVPGHPYFGHLRGRYTYDELRECEDYAYALGIEIVPCIQTLAHLARVLQWKRYAGIADTPDILLADEAAGHEFLRAVVQAAAAPFRSKRIHLGMDEAHFVGLGEYLRRHGPKDRFEILNRHLSVLTAICDIQGLKPIIWSDMYFRLVDPTGDYAAENIPDYASSQIPKNVQLVYWDYFSTDREFYTRKLRQHEKMKPGTMFAGCVWTMNGMVTAYNKTFITSLPAMRACRDQGVREVLVTLWGDDGAETHFMQALLGLQLYAEFAHGMDVGEEAATEGAGAPGQAGGVGELVTAGRPGRVDQPLPSGVPDGIDLNYLETRFAECCKADAQAFLLLDRVDNVHGDVFNDQAVNTSKLILYQDILTGLFDRHFEGLTLGRYYEDLSMRFAAYAGDEAGGTYCADLFGPIAALCKVLAVKAVLGPFLKHAYDAGNKQELASALPRLDDLIDKTLRFKKEYMALLYRDFKVFGLEVHDIRLGGVLARLETARARLRDYVDGRIASLPELEADRVFHDGREPGDTASLIRFNRWHQTVTTSYIGHNIP